LRKEIFFLLLAWGGKGNWNVSWGSKFKGSKVQRSGVGDQGEERKDGEKLIAHS
jgi:hypothetical protein